MAVKRYSKVNTMESQNHTVEAIESFAQRTESPSTTVRIGYDCKGMSDLVKGVSQSRSIANTLFG